MTKNESIAGLYKQGDIYRLFAVKMSEVREGVVTVVGDEVEVTYRLVGSFSNVKCAMLEFVSHKTLDADDKRKKTLTVGNITSIAELMTAIQSINNIKIK